MNTFFEKHNAIRFGKVLIFLGIALLMFVGTLFVNQMKEFEQGTDLAKATTIDVSGTGTAFAIPNIANESFTIEQKAATVQDAQATIAKKTTAVLSFLKSSGIAEKDIQTTDYNAYPEYSYPTPCSGTVCPMIASQPKLIGYTVSEVVTIKIRDTSKVGAIVDGLGSRGVTGLTGPNFSVDNPDAVNAEARALAINDAREKAEVLAHQLGVSLVRVIHFSDNSGGYPTPMYSVSKDMSVGSAAPTTEMSPGQNKYVSNVTITYEIQ